MEGDFLQAGALEPLARLDGVHEVAGLHQRVVGAGIQPGEAAAEQADVQVAALKVGVVHVGDFQFAAG
ncbi:hypothetical protein D3C80_2209620 [compost metagenome]